MFNHFFYVNTRYNFRRMVKQCNPPLLTPFENYFQLLERWIRYYNIIRNRQNITLDYRMMSLKQLIYLIMMLSFNLNLKMKNKYMVGLELETLHHRASRKSRF